MIPVAIRAEEAIAAVCPVLGVTIGRMNGNLAITAINYAPAATAQQKAAADQAAAAFDFSPAVHAAWEADREPDKKNLKAAAQQAIDDNQTYLAINNPNNAQVVAQVRRLTQQNNSIIKRLIQL